MGVFEWPPFAAGTKAVAEAVADVRPRYTVVGGGDSVRALRSSASPTGSPGSRPAAARSLELLEGKELPGRRGDPGGMR